MKRAGTLKQNKRQVPGWRILFTVIVGVVIATVVVGLNIQTSRAISGQTQMQLNKEACDDYKKADSELNRAYQTILREYGNDRPFIISLRKAQLAWIRYRDAHVDSIYPGAVSQYGSVNQMCRCTQLATITRERTKVLTEWVEGVEEGDVCAGSVKLK